MNFNGEDIDDNENTINALVGIESYSYALKKFDRDLKNSLNPLTNPLKKAIYFITLRVSWPYLICILGQ